MNKLLTFIIVILLYPLVYAQAELTPLAYQFELEYSNGEINFNQETLNLVNTYLPDLNKQPKEGYRAEVVSFSNEKLHTYMFNFPLEVWSDYGEECINQEISSFDPSMCPNFEPYYFLNDSMVVLSIPYFPLGKQINIYDKHKLILKIDVSNFSDFCGNGICEIEEEGICDVDCGKMKTNWLNILNIIIIFIIILIIIVFSFLKYKKNKRYRHY